MSRTRRVRAAATRPNGDDRWFLRLVKATRKYGFETGPDRAFPGRFGPVEYTGGPAVKPRIHVAAGGAGPVGYVLEPTVRRLGD